MKHIANYALIILLVIVLFGCNQASLTTIHTENITKTSTLTLQPTIPKKETPIPTQTPNPTSTSIPTSTKTPQTLGRIFPENFHGQAVWSNAGGNSFRNYADTGWFCPPDGTIINCNHHVIHFDIKVPLNFRSNDPVLSPVDGKVSEIYSVGDGQFAIVIKPAPFFKGLGDLLSNQDRIETLSKDIFSFSYSSNDVVGVALHLSHVVPLVKVGDSILKKEAIASVFWDRPEDVKGIGYVIYLYMNDGTYWQFSPCDIPNEDEFCGKCASGTIYPCP